MAFASTWHPDFDPFSDVRRLHNQIDRLLGRQASTAAGAFPAVNLWAGPDSIAVTAELPGVAPDDVEVSVREDVLTIRGSRAAATISEPVGWHRRERSHGHFQRLVQLPFRVAPDRVEARVTNGVLAVELHRPEQDKPRRIEIKS
ncbi:MAG: Hsp20/alpha crystallin family protein [Gammaproteobacteria bacterium]|nr:MAG: Hsp20/alpha crystallin family protein [Gammaproteobacteria bacterium]